jgi:glyoxylase-like metal-dependent hydrolase (beta-lactamase superfamily II)
MAPPSGHGPVGGAGCISRPGKGRYSARMRCLHEEPSVPESPQVTPFLHADSGTWSYLVADPASRAAAIIDPVLDYEPRSASTTAGSAQAILDRARSDGLSIEWILETHAHADHLSAGDWLRRQLPQARLAIGAGIRGVQAVFAELFNLGDDFPRDGSQFDRLFDDGERFAIGSLNVQAIAVPGHTQDCLAYWIGDAVFVGDTVFMPDLGSARCDFPGADPARLFRSVHERLFALPASTRLFVCHDYPPAGREHACESSVGEQRQHNIHLHEGIREHEFVQLRQARDATLPVPALLLPSLQVNIRAGQLPEADDNGVRYLRLPLNRLPRAGGQ